MPCPALPGTRALKRPRIEHMYEAGLGVRSDIVSSANGAFGGKQQASAQNFEGGLVVPGSQ